MPAVVVGAGLNGLGVARSLDAAGVKTWIVDTDPRRPGMRTHCARPLRVEALQGEGLVDTLVAQAQSLFAEQRPVLLLTQELAVRTAVGAQETLRPWYRFVWPEAAVLNALMHKPSFDELAKSAGLHVPATLHVRSAADLDLALELSMPVVIKPARHEPEYERYFQKAYRVCQRTQVRDLLVRMLDVMPDLIVQEWIPGDDTHLYFCLQVLSESGQVQAGFLGRKIRAWPPGTGGTASCMPANGDSADLAEQTRAFFTHVGMYGLAGMEYKRHAETGKFVAIEPTVGRTDYQAEVATLNGVNLPYVYYKAALGDSTATLKAAAPRRPIIWRDHESDRRSSESAEQSVSGWPIPARVSDALWRFSDPAPWFALRAQRIVRRLLRLAGGDSSGAARP